MPKTLSFTVIGGGAFPLDMLRYDNCWPSGPDDAGKIADSIELKTGRREITLRTNLMSVPTASRWNSFGWKVK